MHQETNNQDIHEKWLTEDFILDEMAKADQEEKMIILFDYLQLLKEYDEELGLE